MAYAVRMVEPGKIRIFNKLKGGLFLAAVPAKNTNYVLERVRDVYPTMSMAKNILQTSLQKNWKNCWRKKFRFSSADSCQT